MSITSESLSRGLENQAIKNSDGSTTSSNREYSGPFSASTLMILFGKSVIPGETLQSLPVDFGMFAEMLNRYLIAKKIT